MNQLSQADRDTFLSFVGSWVPVSCLVSISVMIAE